MNNAPHKVIFYIKAEVREMNKFGEIMPDIKESRTIILAREATLGLEEGITVMNTTLDKWSGDGKRTT